MNRFKCFIVNCDIENDDVFSVILTIKDKPFIVNMCSSHLNSYMDETLDDDTGTEYGWMCKDGKFFIE